MANEPLHVLLTLASQGSMPVWTQAGKKRRGHVFRVAMVMGVWANIRGEHARDIVRWRAAGILHDALRDADPQVLLPDLPERFAAFPPKAFHGPVASVYLEREGIEDEDLLDAIRYHTIGTTGLADMGLALYAADFLEPGRTDRAEWRESLRGRAPFDLLGVVREIVSARICYLEESGSPVHPETVGLWKSLADGP